MMADFKSSMLVYALTDITFDDGGFQIVHAGYGGAAYTQQQVAVFYAFGIRIAAPVHLGNVQSRRQTVVMLIEWGQALALDAQGGPSGDVALAEQLIDNGFYGGAGNGKANPRPSTPALSVKAPIFMVLMPMT